MIIWKGKYKWEGAWLGKIMGEIGNDQVITNKTEEGKIWLREIRGNRQWSCQIRMERVLAERNKGVIGNGRSVSNGNVKR